MSRAKEMVVDVFKVRTGSTSELPAFIGLFHRHFQKSMPTVASDREATVTAPVDLLDLMMPESLLKDVESVEVHYKK